MKLTQGKALTGHISFTELSSFLTKVKLKNDPKGVESLRQNWWCKSAHR